MYGVLTYGQTPYDGLDSFATGASVTVVVEASVSASAAHGIGGDAVVSVPNLVVSIGADQVPRECTVTVESGLSVAIDSTIPTYAVGLIAPTVSTSSYAFTTVSGVCATQVLPRVVIYASHPLPLSVSIVAPIRLSATVSTTPAGLVEVSPVLAVAASGLVVTHARGAITIPAYVSSQVVTGFVGNASAIVRSIFSAAAVHSKSASVAVTPVVSVAGVVAHGCAIVGAIDSLVGVSASAGSFDDIQISGVISVPVYPYIRCGFNDNSSYADIVYVKSIRQSVVVRQ